MGPSDGLHDTCGLRRCSGGRTRTLNNWTRTSRVADYTTPEWVGVQISRAATQGPSAAATGRARCIGAAGGKMPAPGSLGKRAGFGGSRHARWWTYGGGRPGWARSARRSCSRPSPAQRRGTAGMVVKVTPGSGPLNGQIGHRQRPWPAQSAGDQPPDLVRHRVHRRRPGPGGPLHRHPPLRHHHARPSRSATTGTFSPSFRRHDAESSATATAGRPAMPPASSAWGRPRDWAPSSGSPSRRAQPGAASTTTTTTTAG